MKTVELVSPYEVREQFFPLHKRKTRWSIGVCHRRAGKTVSHINELVMGATKCPLNNPRFAYIAPQLNQAKDIAWTYLKEYTAFLSPKINESELWVELPGGARIRIYGADNPDRLRGIYLDGVVLDEFGDMDPTIWTQVVRPALSDRKGWACFIGTPKGKNTFHKLWVAAEGDEDWTRLELKASQTGLLDDKELADAKRMMTDDEYAQEYECSFDAAVRGAYYGREFVEAETAEPSRITSVPHDPRLLTHTAWDLGMADSTVIWFFQVVGRETRVIDVLKGEGVALDWYARELQQRGYLYGNHYLPHDVEVRELGTGKSRKEVLESLGITNIRVAPNIPVADGIQAARMLLPTCWFDKVKCKEGIEALRMYRRDWDDKRQEFRANPLHDWCFTGDTKVLTRNGMRRIDSLDSTGEVLTPCGWKRYHSPRVTRRNAPLVEVVFADGLTVRCTPDHMFKTVSGWKSAECLEMGSAIQSSLTFSRSISMAASTAFGRVKYITRRVVKSFIATCGGTHSGQYQKVVISTTGTVIPATTQSLTLNAWMLLNIGALLGNPHSKQRAESTSLRRLETRRQTGIVQKKGGFGISATLNDLKAGPSGGGSLARAYSAARNLIASFGQMVTARSSVIRTAKPLTIANVRRLTETSDVWCMTVPGEEAFSLVNGAVVHNCSHYADAFRYFAVGHQEVTAAPVFRRSTKWVV